MKIFVIGAGVVGVSTAWYLTKSGHEVTVIEKLHAPAEETSFANGGQVSVGHTEPWAQPEVLPKIIQWLGQIDAPIRFTPQWDIHQWLWGLRFFVECLPSRVDYNTLRLAALGAFSLQELQQVKKQLKIEYDGVEKGILHLYTNDHDFKKAAKKALFFEKQGIERRVVSAQECMDIEPALQRSKAPIVGGTYTSTDESGDAAKFTKALAIEAEKLGATFCFNTEVVRIQQARGTFKSLMLRQAGEFFERKADAVVVTAGCESVSLLRQLDISAPIYPLKGYSATFEIINPDLAPWVSLTDEGKRMVFSRLNGRYRAAGMAELVGFNKEVDQNRAKALAKRVDELFPQAMNLETIEYWAGLRPATPTNVPYIGKTPVDGIFVNTGHGTLGWTLSCGSAALLRDILEKKTPSVPPAYYQI